VRKQYYSLCHSLACLCTLIAQSTTGVQPDPAPDSNRLTKAKVRLLNPAINYTHCQPATTPQQNKLSSLNQHSLPATTIQFNQTLLDATTN
jgi:hypothetical protein